MAQVLPAIHNLQPIDDHANKESEHDGCRPIWKRVVERDHQ
jgi:hypothetical protein